MNGVYWQEEKKKERKRLQWTATEAWSGPKQATEAYLWPWQRSGWLPQDAIKAVDNGFLSYDQPGIILVSTLAGDKEGQQIHNKHVLFLWSERVITDVGNKIRIWLLGATEHDVQNDVTDHLTSLLLLAMSLRLVREMIASGDWHVGATGSYKCGCCCWSHCRS